MNRIHGTLLIGDLGDRLIEIAASLGILLLVTGLYLWYPKDAASWSGFLKVRLTSGSRILLRDLHANIGGVLSLVLLFFLISGLSWAGVWGAKLVQAWNTFPTYYTWGDKPESSLQMAHNHHERMTHADMNHGDTKELPWNLEQAPIPESVVSHHGHATSGSSGDYSLSEHAVLIDEIAEKAQSLGFSRYRVFLPSSNTGVYTIAANSMAGDITDAREDRTTHIDQYTGEVLMDVTWNDYSVFAKFMAVGVSLHQGDLSLLNKVLNILFCIAFVFVSVSGALMWWWRRPRSSGSIGAPPRFQQDGVWKTGLVTLILVCLMFPLGGLAVMSILILDWLLFSRFQRLKAILR
ncbi:uncharacterized iron-regulated membrane protein [Vibrio maritimus]|uniref:Uncharacterized iron-regulated membrane protein n=1 Tax=Vibrio maritimus TaxID=990268 RepID=A0A090S847_9VIBR|nr:uncharacterized iron-regulated membrane protein [Vibrio maritimus]